MAANDVCKLLEEVRDYYLYVRGHYLVDSKTAADTEGVITDDGFNVTDVTFRMHSPDSIMEKVLLNKIVGRMEFIFIGEGMSGLEEINRKIYRALKPVDPQAVFVPNLDTDEGEN